MDNELIGDPLDVKMFQSTGWVLEEPLDLADELVLAYVRPPFAQKSERKDSLASDSSQDQSVGNYQLALIKRFEFSAKLQRMSVIVRNFLDYDFRVYVKGSPEKIRELCVEESIPNNYDEILQIYTEYGYRVIALAYRPINTTYLKAQKLTREQCESSLSFLGFLILQNKLKPATTPAINQLHQANIRTIMATGDNVLTAISVARECAIIDSVNEVFLGEVKVEEGRERVAWRSTQNNKQVLDEGTLQPKGMGDNMSLRRSSMHEEDDKQSVNDIVSLDDFPWQHPPELYSIAITGKAFNLLLNDSS